MRLEETVIRAGDELSHDADDKLKRKKSLLRKFGETWKKREKPLHDTWGCLHVFNWAPGEIGGDMCARTVRLCKAILR